MRSSPKIAAAMRVRAHDTRRKKARGRAVGVVAPQRVPAMEALYIVLVESGMRRAEALRLDWQDIHLDGRAAYLADTKNGHARSVPLTAVVVEALERLGAATGRVGKVFPIGVHAVVDSWQRARKVAGAEDLHIHDLRHEAISRLAESGVFQLHELQAISGHRDLRCLTRYVHRGTDRTRAPELYKVANYMKSQLCKMKGLPCLIT